jgi:hypothetical protein
MLGNPDLRTYIFIIKLSLRILFFHVAHIRKHNRDLVEIWDRRLSLFTISIFRKNLNKIQRRPSVIFNSCVVLSQIYKTINLPVSYAYACETWSLAERGEHRFRVFENSLSRRKLRPQRKESIQ